MRIGHLTLLCGYNYGGLLQAWATQEILRSRGHEVISLDYHPARRMQMLRKLFPGMHPCHKSLGRFLDKCKFAGADLFDGFRKDNFTFSAPCTGVRDLERACAKLDAVVVGSDQVWSPGWVRPPYFIDFKLPPACKRVSLAACCGFLSDDPDYLDYVAHTLARFDDLSVRNKFTADLVNRTTGRTPAVICDPTIATDVPSVPVPGISGPYILAYIINRKHSIPLATEVLLKLKRQTGLPVYGIPPAELKGRSGLPVDKTVGPITPFQWNHLIANASWLVTDSFHGTVFSLKHHRDLTVISSGFKTAGRIEALLSAAGLTDRMVTKLPEGNIAHIAAEYWRASDRYLSEERVRYHEFLAKSLGSAKSDA
jgi:hypothetical protein